TPRLISSTTSSPYTTLLRSNSAFDNNLRGEMAECRSDLEDAYFDAVDLLEGLGWEYDPDGGKECISAKRSLRNDCSNDASQEIRSEEHTSELHSRENLACGL